MGLLVPQGLTPGSMLSPSKAMPPPFMAPIAAMGMMGPINPQALAQMHYQQQAAALGSMLPPGPMSMGALSSASHPAAMSMQHQQQLQHQHLQQQQSSAALSSASLSGGSLSGSAPTNMAAANAAADKATSGAESSTEKKCVHVHAQSRAHAHTRTHAPCRLAQLTVRSQERGSLVQEEARERGPLRRHPRLAASRHSPCAHHYALRRR